VETFPEIDRVEWFKLSQARRKLKAAQVPISGSAPVALAADR
jgi:predicted NUDIX family NTP pyrophosphohydrolase